MEKRKISIIALAVLSMSLLLMFDYLVKPVYAISGFQSQTAINITGSTLSTCGGIGVTPITNYIIQQCDNGGTTQTTIASFANGGVQISGATRTVGTGETANTDCWGVTDTKVICETGRTAAGNVILIETTVTSSTSISIVTFSTGAYAVAGGITELGSDLYLGTTAGGFNRISKTTFSPTGSWSGLQTGNCTTLRTALALNPSTGLAICDTNEAYLFSFFGNSGTVTFTGSVSLIGNFVNEGSVKAIYSNNFVYITDRLYNRVQAVGVDIINRFFTVNPIQLPLFANDIKGSGSYLLLIDGSTDQLYVIDKTGTPPNNIVVTQALNTAVGDDVKLTTSDSSTFFWSKGLSGGSIVTFFKGTELRNQNDFPTVNTKTNPTGGIDCNSPENTNILTCRLQEINQTPLVGATQLINASSTDLACQIGLVACTNGVPDNANIQTNGIGYIMLIIALGIWVGLLWVASRGNITEIPNFVWMIGTIAVVGAITVIGWIDPTILIVSIITVIALAGIKAKNVFGGVGGMFKGEEV